MGILGNEHVMSVNEDIGCYYEGHAREEDEEDYEEVNVALRKMTQAGLMTARKSIAAAPLMGKLFGTQGSIAGPRMSTTSTSGGIAHPAAFMHRMSSVAESPDGPLIDAM